MGARASKSADSLSHRIESALQRHAGERLVLAVSGGRDSMALMHAASRVLRPQDTLVATFDHATGRAATRAASLVASEGARLGFAVVVGRASANAGSEAGWRQLRQAFLREVAGAFGGRVVTAHTRDDQVETVLMRVLRHAGARGLAGLYASPVAVRPLLEFPRSEVAEYARLAGARWIEDPTNTSDAFLRNRVRRDLLPALSRVDPSMDAALLATARRAAALRRNVDEWAAQLSHVSPDGSRLTVPVRPLLQLGPEQLALLWPAIAARIGVAMDWRGTVRLAGFTRRATAGSHIPLAGGWVVFRARDRFELLRPAAGTDAVELAPETQWQEWRFRAARRPLAPWDPWVARLPEHEPLFVRGWRAGDRMLAGGRYRKVKRFLSDAGITGETRVRWPVVVAGDEVVWIPGVRRSDAAAVRPGRPGVLYHCDIDRR